MPPASNKTSYAAMEKVMSSISHCWPFFFFFLNIMFGHFVNFSFSFLFYSPPHTQFLLDIDMSSIMILNDSCFTNVKVKKLARCILLIWIANGKNVSGLIHFLVQNEIDKSGE